MWTGRALRGLRSGLVWAGCLLGGIAFAQSTDTTAGSGSTPKIVGAGSGSSATGTNAIDKTQGGVAGTGMGKMPVQTDQPGTGQSVKGAAGQGITHETESPERP